MIIHSHRGLGHGQPENTLAAFRAALDRGHGIETDVRLRSDGQIVLKHDPLRPGEDLPTFEALAELLHEYSPLPLDTIALHLKAGEQTPPMLHTLARHIMAHNLEQTVFIFDLMRPAIDLFKKLETRIRLSISVGAEHHTPTIFTIDDLPMFSDINIYWMDEWSVPYSVNNEKSYRRFKSEGKKLYVISPDVAIQNGHPWAKDRKYVHLWRSFIEWGADGICTDLPQELTALIPVQSLR